MADNRNEEIVRPLTEAELARMEQELIRFGVPYPDELEIDRTVQAARIQMRISHTPESRFTGLHGLIRLALSEVSLARPFFWVASLLLYSIGAIVPWIMETISPMYILFVLSPIPFMLGLVEVFRGRDEGMLELEMSCTYNAVSVMLAKLWVIGIYNIVLNVVISLWFAGVTDAWAPGEFIRVWLAPFAIVCGISLLVASRLRGSYAIMGVLLVWGSLCLLLVSPSLLKKLMALPVTADLLIVLAGLILLGTQVKRIKKEATILYEGSVAE